MVDAWVLKPDVIITCPINLIESEILSVKVTPLPGSRVRINKILHLFYTVSEVADGTT